MRAATAINPFHVVAPCGHSVPFDASLLDAVATRCPTCGTATSTRALAAAASCALLHQLGREHRSSSLDDLSPVEHSWLQNDRENLAKHGLQVCRGVVDIEIAEAVRCEAETALQAALALPPDRAADVLTGVRDPEHRHDVRLELGDALRALLRALLRAHAPPGIAIEEAFGERARLCECSCIIADPGAPAQSVHCDTAADAELAPGAAAEAPPDAPGANAAACCRLLTAFVALQDIDAAMGPTCMWPGTHTSAFHEAVQDDGPHAAFDGRPSAAMTLRCGDCALMDSRLWHCGSANTSAERRFLLVVSFGATGALPEGSTYSLLPKLEGQLSLRDLREGRTSRDARQVL